MFRSLLCLLCNLVALGLPLNAVAEVNVLVTIKPLQLLTEAIIGDKGRVSTLMSADSSPHHYTLSPADRIAIEAADLIIYIGEELETQFDSVMGQLRSRQNILKILDLQSLERLSLKPGEVDTDGRDSQRFDPHIWLDTDNASIIAATIRDQLSIIDNTHASEYAENFNRFNNTLNDLENQWQAKLQSTEVRSYLVYHDAFGYFETQFGLSHQLVMVEDPEMQPGMRQILSVRETITEIQPVCLFIDESARAATINTMLSGYKINTVQLDLLGKRLTDMEGYEQLMENLVNDFINCF